MGMAEYELKRDEKIDGVIYDMSPRPHFRHGIVNGNVCRIISNQLKNSFSLCRVFMGNLDYHYHLDINDDYVCPDIMIVCDRKDLKGSFYNGKPRFIAETASPSTAKRDRTVKKDIYEQAGVEEYWIVSPQGALEIYYLEDGKYVLQHNYMLQGDREEEDYNADQEIHLRAFPHITMTLGEIFEDID